MHFGTLTNFGSAGKALECLPEHSQDAEDCLSKAVRAVAALSTTELFELVRADQAGSLACGCLERSRELHVEAQRLHRSEKLLAQCSATSTSPERLCADELHSLQQKHKTSLQTLSLVLRNIGDGKERQDNIAESVKVLFLSLRVLSGY